MELAKDEFENLLLMMIIKKDLYSFASGVGGFGEFIHFLRDDVPNISRAMMKKRLDTMNEKELKTLEEKLDHNTGKFSITIDKCRSGNSLDFLGITLPFYNN